MALIPFDTLILFMTAALALNLTPGPDMLFCLGSGASRGPKAGIAAALGVSAGAMVHTAAAAFGLAGLLMASPTLFEIVRWAGAAYLVWLAWTTWHAPPPAPAQQAGLGDDGLALEKWRANFSLSGGGLEQNRAL